MPASWSPSVIPEATGRKAMAAQAGGVFPGAADFCLGVAARAVPVRPMTIIKPTHAIRFISMLPRWIELLGMPPTPSANNMDQRARGGKGVALVLPAFLRRVRPMRARTPLLLAAALF